MWKSRRIFDFTHKRRCINLVFLKNETLGHLIYTVTGACETEGTRRNRPGLVI